MGRKIKIKNLVWDDASFRAIKNPNKTGYAEQIIATAISKKYNYIIIIIQCIYIYIYFYKLL